MKNLLSKVARTVSLSFRGQNRSLLSDLQLINKFFTIHETGFSSVGEYHKFILKVFSDIATQTDFRFHFYHREGRPDERWLDGLNPSNRDIRIPAIVHANMQSVYRLPVKMHIFNRIEDRQYISFRLGKEYFYLIELTRKKESDYLGMYLIPVLGKINRLYEDAQERIALSLQVTNLEQKLDEKSRALQVAERAVRRKVYDLHNLVEASNEIYSILNFRQLINSALLTIIGQLGIQSSFAMMYDASKHVFNKNFQKGIQEAEIQTLTFSIESEIARYFVKHPAPVYVDDIKGGRALQAFVSKLKKVKISVIAPILYSERLHGVIGVGEKLYGSKFEQTDFELFHVLINIISISIENATHYEEVKNLSLTDAMTNLHNYRYFSIRLKEELNRARRNKTKVSLLILDIDHFKNYNDTLGHQTGDEALRTLGRVLKSTVRDEDVVSRYGGEEFCIILPGISKKGILTLGERVRRIIELHKFYKETVQPGGRMTVSLGGATYPDDAKNPDDLVQRADQALYKAKNYGRNQLVIYQSLSKKPVPVKNQPVEQDAQA
jgi:diguanylate cyclase (GGDEF)-like protein